MLKPTHRLALYMEGNLAGTFAKMGLGILRLAEQEVVAVIDSDFAGCDVREVVSSPRSCPVVATVDEAADLGADVLVLGIAPSGGRLPESWLPDLDRAISRGMSLVNGLHNPLAPRYSDLAAEQFVWDVRQEPADLGIATGAAARLTNRRVLMIGTDMAIGKMTAGLALWRAARAKGIRCRFVATGQIGMVLTGSGIALDAIRVDYACGAVEAAVLAASYDTDLVIVEGQGALLHPGSTANLPLIRGTCPTHLILCHELGKTTLLRLPEVAIPPLRPYTRLYEELASVLGTYPRPVTAGICLNTSPEPDADRARLAMDALAKETGLPVIDPVRFGAEPMVDWVT